MFKTLFKEKAENKNNDSDVYTALINGLAEMQKQFVDRVVLTSYETERDKNVGGFVSLEKTKYYPFEMLSEEEQEMIKGKKSYSVVALVADNVGGIVRYPERGIEEYNRTRIFPLLPELKPESNLYYITKGGELYTGDGIKEFAERAASSGFTKELVEQSIKAGIAEYHAITKRLMEKAGVYKALEKMEKRKTTPLEEALFPKHNSVI